MTGTKAAAPTGLVRRPSAGGSSSSRSHDGRWCASASRLRRPVRSRPRSGHRHRRASPALPRPLPAARVNRSGHPRRHQYASHRARLAPPPRGRRRNRGRLDPTRRPLLPLHESPVPATAGPPRRRRAPTGRVRRGRTPARAGVPRFPAGDRLRRRGVPPGSRRDSERAGPPAPGRPATPGRGGSVPVAGLPPPPTAFGRRRSRCGRFHGLGTAISRCRRSVIVSAGARPRARPGAAACRRRVPAVSGHQASVHREAGGHPRAARVVPAHRCAVVPLRAAAAAGSDCRAAAGHVAAGRVVAGHRRHP